ncbi:MAG: cyclic nucleotide-binding domain-containing protein [Desulfobacula sp.]|nr:cyclic nucleotide-binding domain-containing protein [Desulfobacula sp.]
MGKNLQDLVEFLLKVPLFSSVPPEQINEIADLFKRETYRKDEVICRQKDPADSMYVIRSGIVSVFKEIDGREVYVSDLKRGGFFGEISLLSGESRNATIRVSLDTTLYCLTRKNFELLIKNNKSIGLYLSRYYAKRMVSEETNQSGKKNVPVFYAVSATGPDLGVSHFLYTVSFHISDESEKRVLVIEPHLEPERIMEKYGLTRIVCPDTALFAILPEKSYNPEDIHWFIHESGFTVLQLTTGFSDRLSEMVPLLMEGLQLHYDIIFVNLSHYLTSMERLFVRLCDRTLVLMHNTHETLEVVRKKLKELEQICGASAFLGRIRVGVSHLYGQKGIPRQEMKRLLNLPEIPNIWVDRSDDAFNDRIDTEKCFPVKGARAVAREIAGIRLGIAFGAGAARGWAHIGVLKVLEDAGIHIDMISGASVGGLIGGGYAATASVDELKKYTFDQFPTKLAVRKKIFDFGIPFHGLLKGDKVVNLIRTAVKNADFLDLLIPTYIVGVDILKGEEVVFETGDVTDAIRSSISIPAIFSPHKYKGKWMVDGGLLNPVPVDVLLRKGADMVIAVCIEPRSGGSGGESRAPGIKSVVFRTISIVHGRATGNFTKNADIVIYPNVQDYAWDDFHKGISLMRYGMEACFEQLEDIKKLIRSKGAR